MIASITSDITGNPLSSAEYEFIVTLEIREKVAKVRQKLLYFLVFRSVLRKNVSLLESISIGDKRSFVFSSAMQYRQRSFDISKTNGIQ